MRVNVRASTRLTKVQIATSPTILSLRNRLWLLNKSLSGSYVIQNGELFREEPGGTYTPVGRVRK